MSVVPISLAQHQRGDGARRLIDIVVSLFGLICVSPLFPLLALLIRLDSPGPIFYRAKRVGKEERIFDLFKFRSMTINADKQGPGITSAGDRRVTRIGSFLRRTKLDELPQLLNVLSGEMSLVGPRPEDPRYIRFYTVEQRQVLTVRPGITSAASLAFRHEEQLLIGKDWEAIYQTQIMPSKLAIDLQYLAQRTLFSDLKLIVQTVRAMAQ